MDKTFTEFLYGKDFKNALDCFENKLNFLEIEHSQFLKDNEINFKEAYIISFNSKTVSYSIVDEKVNKLMNSEFDKYFYECFSTILTMKSKN